jgi:hypothetical protein
MATAAAPMPAKVSQTGRFENQSLVYCPMMFLFLAIRVMMKIRGTATTPLITAAYTRALIGSIPDEVEQQPDQGCHDDDAIKSPRFGEFLIQSLNPLQALLHRIGC